MGADLILTTAPMSEASIDILKGRVDRITADNLRAIADDLYPYAVEDDDDGGASYVRNEIRVAIDEIVPMDRRDVQTLMIGETGVYITGGLSGGDDPTDAWPYVQVLAWSEVTDDIKWVD